MMQDQYKAELATVAERHRDSLSRQLDLIFEDEPETAPSIDSFRALLTYLNDNVAVYTPSIGFNRDGSFSAIWIKGYNWRMTLDFLSQNRIRRTFVDLNERFRGAATGTGIVAEPR